MLIQIVSMAPFTNSVDKSRDTAARLSDSFVTENISRNESPEDKKRTERLRSIVARISDNRISYLRYRDWQDISEARID